MAIRLLRYYRQRSLLIVVLLVGMVAVHAYEGTRLNSLEIGLRLAGLILVVPLVEWLDRTLRSRRH